MVHWARNELQNFDMLPEYPKYDVPQILQEVETIGNLHGVRSSPPCCFGILAAAIPAHYLHTRMLSEPTGEGVHTTPVGQNVHQRMTFEIH
jgi:hypothetical protein